MNDAAPTESLKPAAVLAALGFVLGDLATSPLYALNAAFGPHGVAATPANVLGLLSLIVWTLLLLVGIKVLGFVQRADNGGEGGIMALLVLARRALSHSRPMQIAAVVIGLSGAAALVAHAAIMPALAIRSAVSGFVVVGRIENSSVAPSAVLLVMATVWLQRRGLHRFDAWFGPLVVVWLVVIAALAALSILHAPAILKAFNPALALNYVANNGVAGFATLAVLVLVMAGSSALCSEIGRFGTAPIRWAWFAIALPALLIAYLGQGALLLGDPSAASAPFFQLAPRGAVRPLALFAVLVSIMAARCLWSGIARMLREAAQLGFLPRIRVVRSSGADIEHIHLPGLNGMVLFIVVAALLSLHSIQALAAACAIAAASATLATTLLATAIARWQWGWSPLRSAVVAAVFLAIDLALLGACAMEIEGGGWFALLIAFIVVTLMLTWLRGRNDLLHRTNSQTLSLESFCTSIAAHPPQRVDITAIFLTAQHKNVPQALLHNLKYNHVLHARNVILTVESLDEPIASKEQRWQLSELGNGFFRATLCFGFAEEIDVPAALKREAPDQLKMRGDNVAYFLGREAVVASSVASRVSTWRDRLFVFMARNASPAYTYFRIPSNQLIEIGVRWEL